MNSLGNLTVFLFQEKINMSGIFSRNMSCWFWWLWSSNQGFDRTAIRVNLHWFFIRFQVSQSIISTFSLFSGSILVNVIATCSNFRLLFSLQKNFTISHFTIFIKLCTTSQLFFNTYKNPIKLLYKSKILQECA